MSLCDAQKMNDFNDIRKTFLILQQFSILIFCSQISSQFLLGLIIFITMSEGHHEHHQHGRFSPHRIENLFFLNGITSLLGWNVILASLDFFQYAYKDYNVYLYFPIPCFIAYVVTCVSFNVISIKFKYSQIVPVGIVGTVIAIGIMVFVTMVSNENPHIRFWISMLLSFCVGFFANLAQLSFFGMINYFGENTVSRFTIGTAGGGLFITILRIIITAILGTDESNKLPILIYITITLGFNLFDLSLNIKLFKSRIYREKIEAPLLNDPDHNNPLLENEKETRDAAPEEVSYLQQMTNTLKHISPYPIFIFFNYIVTFMLFPNLSLAKKTDLPVIWTVLLMLAMYNLGDFIGKIIGDFRHSFNSWSMTFLFFSRFFFFFPIPLMDIPATEGDYLLNNNVFPFFNQLLFAITNGFVTNGCFILSFEHAPNEYKKYAGVLGGICLQMGIMSGTFLAIPLGSWVNPTSQVQLWA